MEEEMITLKDIFDLLTNTSCIFILDERGLELAYTETVSYKDMLKLLDKKVMKISNYIPMKIWVFDN